MEITITSDAWWETRVGESLDQFSLRKINNFFYLKNYGDELERIVICFLCCNPEHYGKLEQKVKFKKKEKHLSIFFVLEYDLFMKINNAEREMIILNKMKNDVPEIMKQNLSKHFNLDDFIKDWLKVIQK
ncbi:hypothetical protein [Flavobacterium piscis]|uniref:Uncharacterized protein n=1 Tax=Flavobacterium piscis TaxID=1114874 RepID=A0ABU1YER0_9FLAO|nr:hypothetical protein [Flavobacterium piscis]MDR7212735.1 hypothetical protein [Flavobacterium piscis]